MTPPGGEEKAAGRESVGRRRMRMSSGPRGEVRPVWAERKEKEEEDQEAEQWNAVAGMRQSSADLP
eukprot:8385438-Pyramimonas_sp.AAC.1